jgi:DNA repair exonuclease SbcCD ATPase subunit
MISLRSSDLGESIQRRDEVTANAVAQQASFERMELLLKKEIRELRESTGSPDVDILNVQNSLETASVTVQELELQLNTLVADRDANLAQLQAHCDESTMCVSLKRDELESKRREHDRALLKVESIQSTRKEFEKKWNLDISNGVADIVPPDVCPTCQQPISDSGKGHSHEDLQRIVQDEVNDVVQHLFAAQVAMQEATNARESAAAAFDVEEMLLQESHVALQEVRSLWADKIKSVEKDLEKARNEQSALSTQLSNAAMAMQQESIIKTKEAALSNAQSAVEACVSVRENICRAVEEAEVRLQELQTSGEAQRNLSVQMTNLADAFGARGVQTFVLQNAIEALQTISQTYLDELSDGSQRLELSLDTGDRISRKAMVRSPDGGFMERPLSSLSGGQWRRCSLALSLGFADLVARRGRFKTSLCVLDEPLTHLDRSGRISVGKLLRSLLRQGDSSGLSHSMSVSTILIILQDLAAEELEESFDHIDEVTKEDGLSFVSIDEQS